jgi:hypothetical protein
VRPFLAGLFFLAGCVGPLATDAELCRDVVVRLCHVPVCDLAVSRLGVDASTCEEVLLARTGCGADEFAFSAPSRDRVLYCRTPLVEESDARLAAPSCENVADALGCPDLVSFLKGAR